MYLSQNIAYYRKLCGYTQEQLAERLGVTGQSVSKWENEVSMPDVMLLPKIAEALDITLDDLFSLRIDLTKSNVFNMDGIHSFAKDVQHLIIDTLYHQSNLPNCGTWDILKVEKNPSTKQYDRVKRNTTLCSISDTVGSAFVSDDLTMIDAGTPTADVCVVFDKPEIASGLRKLSDPNVRSVLSHVCDEYFHSTAPFDGANPEYFEKDINPGEISRSLGLTSDETLDVLEKLTALHIVEVKVEDDGVHYLFQKGKAIETAVIFRLTERLFHSQFGMGCGDFLTLISE